MRIYIHQQSAEDPEVVELSGDTLVSELSADADEQIWLPDEDDPLDATLTLDAAGVRDRGHVHRNRCRRVAVSVRFNGESKDRAFGPGATIARVFRWATGRQGFALPAEQVPKHVLVVRGTEHMLEPETHVGSLVTRDGKCELRLDLVPRERYEG